jgi:hypothetical protein
MSTGAPRPSPALTRVLSLAMRVRWEVALRTARRVAHELQLAHGRLEPDERRRLGELLKNSGGRPTRLSRPERSEIVRLAQKAAGMRAGRSGPSAVPRVRATRRRPDAKEEPRDDT